MSCLINPTHLKWNQDDSIEHFNDPTSFEDGAETFFHVFDDKRFVLCSYSQVKKDYVITTEGVKILKQSQSKDEMCHMIEIEWTIDEPEGHVYIEINGIMAGVAWGYGRIIDMNHNAAKLIKVGREYKVEEILTYEEEETLNEIKRLAKLRDMTSGEVRRMLNDKILGMFK